MTRSFPCWARALAALVATIALAAASPAQSFVKGTLTGANPDEPTSLAFGPDGRLYVAEHYGRIFAYTIVRLDAADYVVTQTEVLEHIYAKPNHDDFGNPDPVVGRQCTGILVVGTPSNPVIYVTSSDPREAVAFDSGLDTNSSILTRLTWNGSSWDELDLVRGLPRCEENHASNGMALDASTNTLYLGQGGHTNMGAPSNNFGLTPEYALSAAILTIDLDAIGESTYDIPTLDDPSRPNTGPGGSDENDPFGGNDGANMAMIVAGGPVQVYSPGFRNPYDIVIHSEGWIYTVDNGPNAGWGGPLIACSNAQNESGSSHDFDGLHKVGELGDGGGYYGGHPNPFRANASNTINGQSPIPPGGANPAECDYLIPGVTDGSFTTWVSSTCGMCEYTSDNFGGAMQGDLLVIGYASNKVERVQLNPDGTMASTSTLLSSAGQAPLDVVSMGDTEEWPGTIWVAAFGGDDVIVYEPDDLSLCEGTYDLFLDEDGDGFTNADEIDNGVDPCSAGDVPPDVDGDLVSDLNDPDDDNDGLLDTVDPFALDDTNGLGLAAPFHYGWSVGDPGTGFFGLGFTGLMNNGSTDYLDQFIKSNVIAGGAAGKVTVDHVDDGDAYALQNDQNNGFQLGVDVAGAGPFTVRTSVEAPFFDNLTPTDGQSHGLFLGDGGQDDYVKLVFAAGGGTGAMQVVIEEGGVVLEDTTTAAPVLASLSVELALAVDPNAQTVQPSYRADGGSLVPLGSPRAVPSSLLDTLTGVEALAVGILCTRGAGPEYAATWDFLEVSQDTTASADVSIGPVGQGIDASTYDGGSFRIENTSADAQEISSITFDLSSAVFPDLVFDPLGLAGDTAFKAFTPDSGEVETGVTGHTFSGDHDGGYDRLTVEFDDFQPGETFTFSVDVDPTTITGAVPPGPEDSGSVSGLELAGTSVTIDFDDGATLGAQTFRAAGSLSESSALVRTDLPTAPKMRIVGAAGTQVVLGSPNRIVRVFGDPGDDVRLMLAEGGLFLAGVPGGGFDVDPFEANSLVAVSEMSGTIGVSGSFDFLVSFGVTEPDAGIHHLAVVKEDGDGATGAFGPVIVAELVPAEPVASPTALDFGLAFPGTTLTSEVEIDNTGAADTSVTLLEVTGDAAFALGSVPAVPFTLGALAAPTPIEVTFTPLAAGPVSGELVVHHEGDDSPLTIPLSGEGSAPDTNVLVRVNCGGPLLVATDATQPWTADTTSSPSPYVNSGVTNTTAAEGSAVPHGSVPPAAPAGLFDTDRYDVAGGADMHWSFPVVAGTLLEVRLYVAETSPGVTGDGQRVFDVSVEGVPVNGFDAYAEAGPGVGFVRSTVVEAADSTLDITFTHVAGEPSIKAIEIVRPGSLVASQPMLSLSQGGSQQLYLNAPPAFAGKNYLMLSSASGTSPGFPFGSVVIPLNPDNVLIFSITSANLFPYVNSFGILDGDGRAQASFAIPPALDPSLEGLVLWHAGVIADGSVPLAASPTAVTLEFTE